MGDQESITMHPTGTEVLQQIELAAAKGWIVRRVLRDYIEISEATLKHDAEKEAKAR